MACLAVICFHSPAWVREAHGPVFRGFATVIGRGWLGVSLFLVLSGFCLYYPLVRKNASKDIRVDLKDFSRRRALRILPPYYIALAIFLIVTYKNEHILPTFSKAAFGLDAFLHGAMLHNLVPATVLSVNPAFWVTCIRTQLYFLFPLLVLVAARYGLRALLASAFAVSFAWQVFCYFHLGQSADLDTNMVFYYALPSRCFEFAAGMAAAALVARAEEKRLRQVGWVGAAFAVPAILLVALGMRFGFLIDQLWGIVFASGLVALSLVPETFFEKGAARLLTLLGVFSYSTYLVHQPLLWWLHKDTRFGRPAFMASDMISAAVLFLEVVAAIGVGYIFFLCAERPFIRFGQKRRRVVNASLPGEMTEASPQPAAVSAK